MAQLRERYEFISTIGEGEFGRVVKARKKISGNPSPANSDRFVAIKTIKVKSVDHAYSLQEVKALQRLAPHPNVVSACDILVDPMGQRLHIVMECMQGNLLQLIQHRQKSNHFIPQAMIKSILFQLLNGVRHIHNYGICHRDLKPENILVSCNGLLDDDHFSQLVVKISDFGICHTNVLCGMHTPYISTRWYRAPEVILRTPSYSRGIDIWAWATIAWELATLWPLFNGVNDLQQLTLIWEALGSPNSRKAMKGSFCGGPWPQGLQLLQGRGLQLVHCNPKPLHVNPRLISADFISLIAICLKWDSVIRGTATQLLKHPYFYSVRRRETWEQAKTSTVTAAAAMHGNPYTLPELRPITPLSRDYDVMMMDQVTAHSSLIMSH